MTAPKSITLFGLLAKLEASYNDGGVLAAATDGILLSEPAQLVPNYAHDGARSRANGTGGTLSRAAPSGRFGDVTIMNEARGLGAAYGAAALPEANVLLRASGHSATVDATPGSESVTYRPISDHTAYASAVIEAYARGEKYPLTGVYGDFNFSMDGPGFLMLEFPISGLMGLPTDVAVPVITYPTVKPPKADSITLAIGAWNPVVQSLRFRANRRRSPRHRLNAGGHRGFSMGGRAPELEVVVEQPALATFDAYAARDQATEYAIALQVGATQFNRMKFNAAVGQIVNIDPTDDDETPLWTLTIALSPSSPTADDDYEFVFD